MDSAGDAAGGARDGMTLVAGIVAVGMLTLTVALAWFSGW